MNPFIFLKTINAYSDVAVRTMFGLTFNSALYVPILYLSSKFKMFDFFSNSVTPIHLPTFVFAIIALLLLLKTTGYNRRKKIQMAALICFDLAIIVLFHKVPHLVFPFVILSFITFFPPPRNEFSFGYDVVVILANKYLSFEKIV